MSGHSAWHATFWVRERTKVRNRIHRLLARQHGLAMPQVTDRFGKKGLSALGKLPLAAPEDLLLRQQMEMLGALAKHIHELDEKIALQLCAYAGLIPTTSSSGDKTYHGRLVSGCNKWLRWALVEAA